jgi:hypothetical protein
MGCIACGRNFHEECDTGCEVCHSDTDRVMRAVTHAMGAPLKDSDKVTDPYSTGRKRAAVQYPIFKTNPCDWRGKKNCGGGEPIVGCIAGFQKDRHHGPIKNPLRNEPGNVHRICKFCHNRWHTVNDPIYDELKYESLPHRPELATDTELMENELYWKLKRP